MPRTVADEQRQELFDIVFGIETPIGEIESFTIVLYRIAERLTDTDDGAAIGVVASEIARRERQLSEAHGKLFHGLNKNPRRVESAEAKVADVRLAGGS